MIDFAQKARAGRLAALNAARTNGGIGGTLSAGGARSHAGVGRDAVMFHSRRTKGNLGELCV